MKYPNFKEEERLQKQGFKCVVGLDEAGRGPLAGPVVAGAVIFLNPNNQTPITNKIINYFEILGINDSKLLSPKKREELYDIITNHPNIKWGIGIVSEKVIDKINILEATKLAMQKAFQQAQGKLHKNLKPDFLLLDGNFKLNEAAFAKGCSVPKQKSIIKGDQKVMSIAMASIIAKVTRDRIMQKMHKKYPSYQFDKHKGYGTQLHIKILKEFGACPIHRKTFRPITEII
jgi:ribonuclease HII